MLAVFVQRRKNVNISHIKEREHISAHTCMYRRMHTCVHIRGSIRRCLQTRVYVLCVRRQVWTRVLQLARRHVFVCLLLRLCLCFMRACVHACVLHELLHVYNHAQPCAHVACVDVCMHVHLSRALSATG